MEQCRVSAMFTHHGRSERLSGDISVVGYYRYNPGRVQYLHRSDFPASWIVYIRAYASEMYGYHILPTAALLQVHVSNGDTLSLAA